MLSHVPGGQLLEAWSNCMTLMALCMSPPREAGVRVTKDSCIYLHSACNMKRERVTVYMLYTLTALPSVPGSRESVTNIPLDTLVALHMYNESNYCEVSKEGYGKPETRQSK